MSVAQHSQFESLIDEVSNDNGVIDVEVEKPSVDIEIDVRSDETYLYESSDGRLFMETEETDTLFEVVPSFDGPVIEMAASIEKNSLTRLETADPAEQPDVSGATVIIEYRAD